MDSPASSSTPSGSRTALDAGGDAAQRTADASANVLGPRRASEDAALVAGCAPDFVAQDGACAPRLQRLVARAETELVEAKLDAQKLQYSLNVPIGVSSAELTLQAPAGVSVSVADEALSGSTWLTPNLALGPNSFEVTLHKPGHPRVQYRVTLVRALNFEQLHADNAGDADRFGYAIALAGDVLAVGAPHEDSPEVRPRKGAAPSANDGAADADFGAVYVFRREDEVWKQEACLKQRGTRQLGLRVALDPVGKTIVANTLDAQVYVFTRVGGSWTTRTVLSPPPGSGGFSESIAVFGDTLVIGDPYTSNASGAELAGAVLVYQLGGDTAAQDAGINEDPLPPLRLEADDGKAEDFFGRAVAVWNDTVVVGAPAVDLQEPGMLCGGDPVCTGAGAVYVFRRDAVRGTWSQDRSRLLAPRPSWYDGFGTRVAVQERFVAVGAPGKDHLQDNADGSVSIVAGDKGAAYVFSTATGALAHTFELGAADGHACLGYAITLDGDRLIAGAPGRGSSDQGDSKGCDAYNGLGSLYIYSLSSEHTAGPLELAPTGLQPGDRFGEAATAADGVVASPTRGSNERGTVIVFR